MENTGINFVNIPIEIFSDTELTANEKILYGYLSIFKKQCCFQSNEALAKALGISVPTVTNALKHLADLEYIFIEFVNNNSAKRRIYVVFDNPKKLKYLVSKGYLKSFPQVTTTERRVFFGSKPSDHTDQRCSAGQTGCRNRALRSLLQGSILLHSENSQ